MQILNKWFDADVKSCERCLKNHGDLKFNLMFPPENDDGYRFFGLCPETNQPLFVNIKTDGMDAIGLVNIPTRPDIDDL